MSGGDKKGQKELLEEDGSAVLPWRQEGQKISQGKKSLAGIYCYISSLRHPLLHLEFMNPPTYSFSASVVKR